MAFNYEKFKAVSPNEKSDYGKLSNFNIIELLLLAYNPLKAFYKEELTSEAKDSIASLIQIRHDFAKSEMLDLNHSLLNVFRRGKTYLPVPMENRYDELAALLSEKHRAKMHVDSLKRMFNKYIVPHIAEGKHTIPYEKFLGVVEKIKDKNERLITEVSYFTSQWRKAMEKGMIIEGAKGRFEAFKRLTTPNTFLYMVTEPNKGLIPKELEKGYFIIGMRGRLKSPVRIEEKIVIAAKNALLASGYHPGKGSVDGEMTKRFSDEMGLPKDIFGLMMIATDINVGSTKFSDCLIHPHKYSLLRKWIITNFEDLRKEKKINNLKFTLALTGKPAGLPPEHDANALDDKVGALAVEEQDSAQLSKNSSVSQIVDYSSDNIRFLITDLFGRLYDEYFGSKRHITYESDSRAEIEKLKKTFPEFNTSIATIEEIISKVRWSL